MRFVFLSLPLSPFCLRLFLRIVSLRLFANIMISKHDFYVSQPSRGGARDVCESSVQICEYLFSVRCQKSNISGGTEKKTRAHTFKGSSLIQTHTLSRLYCFISPVDLYGFGVSPSVRCASYIRLYVLPVSGIHFSCSPLQTRCEQCT